MPTNITLRSQLLGGVTDFCEGSGIQVIRSPVHLVELIVMLAGYREEGISLYPQAYITNNMQELLARLPGGERIMIGVAGANLSGLKAAISKCAPLAIDGWMIYVEDRGEAVEFGVFREQSNPISVSIDSVLMTGDESLYIVRVRQVLGSCVEIHSNTGSHHNVYLNHQPDDAPLPLSNFDGLVEAIAGSVNEGDRESLVAFLRRVLFDSIRRSHGCLIAVTSMTSVPAFFAGDGVVLREPINFPDLIHRFKRGEITSSDLEKKASLLQGMISSDGITVFDTRGRLLGYNFFVQSRRDAIRSPGGARRRAFETLSTRLGRGLAAVLVQSQDGWSNLKRR